MMFTKMTRAFIKGWQGHTSRRICNNQAKNMRSDLSERQIDRMLEDSFPCSDPPSTY